MKIGFLMCVGSPKTMCTDSLFLMTVKPCSFCLNNNHRFARLYWQKIKTLLISMSRISSAEITGGAFLIKKCDNAHARLANFGFYE